MTQKKCRFQIKVKEKKWNGTAFIAFIWKKTLLSLIVYTFSYIHTHIHLKNE